MKYTAHLQWLRENPNPFTNDLVELVLQAQSQPSFNANEPNTDLLHTKIAAAIGIATAMVPGSYAFNKSLHGVAGFGIEDGVAVIISYDLKKFPVNQFDAPEWGLNTILEEIKNKNYHQLVA